MSGPAGAATDVHESAEALLGSVEEVLKTHRELARLRGENFNVFRLLDLESDEDKLHSRFIAELLNPRGSHEQGTTFLELFLLHVGKTGWIRSGSATVQQEKYIGPVVIDGQRLEGGRIDIFITDRDRHLAVENKIGAEEGDEQITRYCNYDREERHFVLFLTLDGKKAKTTKANYSPISYPKHVLPWLEACQRHAADHPILRETIKQYIITVKSRTGGLVMQQANSKVQDAVKQHPKAARAIQRAFSALVDEQKTALVNGVKEEVEKRVQSGIREPRWEITESEHSTWKGLFLRRATWPDRVRVGWQEHWLGIHSPSDELLRASVSDQDFSFDHNDKQWGLWSNVPRVHFESEEGIERLFNDSQRDELAKELADQLLDLAEDCDDRVRDASA